MRTYLQQRPPVGSWLPLSKPLLAALPRRLGLVILTGFGTAKVGVIKAVREITGLGLGEAKALVDGAPATVKEAMAKEAANEAVEKLKAAGATAELK